jgi:hypothetical protein
VPPGVLLEAERLLSLYAELADRPVSSRNICHAVRLVTLCHRLDIASDVLLWSQFQRLQRIPTWSQLISDRSVSRYRSWEGMWLSPWHVRHVSEAEPIDGHIDLTPYGEALKSSLSAPECILSISEHGGYHPLSQRCQGCSVGRQCSGELSRLMGGLDMARLRAIPRPEALSVLHQKFPEYPATPLGVMRAE